MDRLPGRSSARSGAARWIAVVLLLVEGLSGASVGFTLLGGLAGLNSIGGAIAIPIGLVAYGLALAIAGFGMAFGWTWAWWLAIGSVVAGLGLLLVLLVTAGGGDPVLLGGVAIWVITFGALLAARPERNRRAA